LYKLTAFLLTAAPALAHPGHFAPQDGHDHYAVIAGVVVVGVALVFALKRRA
jgi:hypothetical protein